MVALLTIHRRYGPRRVARALAEYATVALLAALLAAPSVAVDQQPANQADSGQARPRPPPARTSPHAAVSTWLNGGVPPTTVAEWAGHSVEVLLRIYAKGSPRNNIACGSSNAFRSCSSGGCG